MAISRIPAEVVTYLHTHIPISQAMGVRVEACGRDEVRLSAPLAANVNHRATVFGGSASALAILAGWTWMHLALGEAGFSCRLVIQRNEMEYLRPIDGDFTARCTAVSDLRFTKLVETLRRRGKARLKMKADLLLEGEVVGRFAGDYVAITHP